MLGWLKESNRMLHLKAGFILFVACIIMQGFVISMYNIRIDFTQEQSDAVMVTMSVASFLCVFFSMCSVEYIQKAAGEDEDTARYRLPSVQGSDGQQGSTGSVPGRKGADQVAETLR